MINTGNDYPIKFLEKLYEQKIRTVRAKIVLMTWDEKAEKEIQGIVKSGNISVDGNSTSRRNLSLEMSVYDRDDQLIASYLTPDKKIQLYIGIDNNTDEREEEKTIWFNMGIFILSNPSFSHSVDTLTLNMSATDKMAMLNGVIGGELQSPVSFAQRQGGELVSLSWREIFLQAAVLFGGEDPAKVVVDSVPDFIKEYVQVKTVGGQASNYIHINRKLEEGEKEEDYERIITRAWHPTKPESEVQFHQGQNLYKLARFGPADPRVSSSDGIQQYMKNSGDTVASIFEDIKGALGGTHEYYYSPEGDLFFRPVQNFINQQFDPEKDPELGYSRYELKDEYFIPDYSNFPYVYDFSDKTTIVSMTNNPDWTNMKNDFIVTGKNGQQLEIAIDHKPTNQETIEWFEGVARDFTSDSPEMDFLAKDGIRRQPYNPETKSVPFEFREGVGSKKPIYVSVQLDKVPWQIAHGLRNYFVRNIYQGRGQERMLPRWGRECESMIFKWVPSADKKHLLPNTGIFNPSLASIGTPWLNGYPIAQSANTEDDVENLDKTDPRFSESGDPKFWPYFLDIVDTGTQLGKYSIERVGKRTKAESEERADTLFRTSPTELVVVTETELSLLGGVQILEDLKKNGQAYAVISDINDQMFTPYALASSEVKKQDPFGFFHGDMSKGEDLILSFEGAEGSWLAGGKSDITFTPNVKENGTDGYGGITISDGDYMHPKTKKVYQGREAFINTPISTGSDPTRFGFIVHVDNKSRLPNSGKHPHIVLAKLGDKKDWFYAEQNTNKWQPFSIEKGKDVIIGGFTQDVTGSGEEIYYGASIVDVHDVFNIREMKNAGMFTTSGGTDLFSKVRSMIYQHTNYAEVVSLNLLPMYHLEPNTLVRIENPKIQVSGTFMITSMSVPLESSGGGLMSLNAIRIPDRI